MLLCEIGLEKILNLIYFVYFSRFSCLKVATSMDLPTYLQR